MTVTDSNDQTPVFQAPLSFTLSEQSSVGALVGVLAASDGDIGTNAELTFSSSASAPFNVQTNGMCVCVCWGGVALQVGVALCGGGAVLCRAIQHAV